MISVSEAYNAQVNWQSSLNSWNSAKNFSKGTLSSSQNQSPFPGEDSVSLSAQGKTLSSQHSADSQGQQTTSSPGFPTPDNSQSKTSTGTGNTSGSSSQDQTTGEAGHKALSARDQEIIRELKKRDAHVRAHEEAHLAVAGQYARSGINLTYEVGPNGVRYAVGGDVKISISDASTPEATIRKMETVRRAALAPADPSAADRQIAAEALSKELHAVEELQTEQKTGTGTNSTGKAQGQTGGPQASSSSNTSSATPKGLSTGHSQQNMINTYQTISSLA